MIAKDRDIVRDILERRGINIVKSDGSHYIVFKMAEDVFYLTFKPSEGELKEGQVFHTFEELWDYLERSCENDECQVVTI